MTHELLCAVFPHFYNHCPHPVTLAGMFEMGSAYLPLRTHRWQKFVESADNAARELEREVKEKLMSAANNACSFAEGERCTGSLVLYVALYVKGLWTHSVWSSVPHI